MKKYLIILVLIYIKSYGQLSPNKNYISIIKPKSPVSVSEITANNYPKDQEVNYFDGLGRNIQNIILGVTPSGKDLIYPIEYDNRGLKSRDYLPYPANVNNNGAYSSSATSETANFYSLQFPTEVSSTGPVSFMNSFSEKIIENSPLLRPTEISAPGKDWRTSDYAYIYTFPAYNYSWSYSEFVTGNVAAGSPITFNVNSSGLLNIAFNFGGPEFKFNLGNIKFLGYVPDADLGYIKNGGANSSYFLSIKNGYLNIASSNNEPLQNVTSTFSYQFDKKNTRLGSANTIKIENGTNKLSQVIKYEVELDSDRNPKLLYKDFYNESKLYRTIVRDENWKPKYHVEWNCNDFSYLNGAVTGSNIILDVNNKVLSFGVNLNVNPWSVIKTGPVKTLDFEINDVNLGNLIDITTGLTLYNVYIEKNALCIKRTYTGTLTSAVRFNTTLTANIQYYNNYNDILGNTEFRDFNDQLILKRNLNADQIHDTQYVYDIYGNLTYVIPPAATDLLVNSLKNITSDVTAANTITSGSTVNLTASNSITLLPGFNAQSGSNFTASIKAGGSDILNDLCYQYKYDSSNRLIEKKLPGKDWEYIVYDILNRPILTQDANLRASNKWLFTKYDVFNRPVYTGFYTNTTEITRAAMQTLAKTSFVIHEKKQISITVINGTSQYYSNLAFPSSGIDLLTIIYYDNYYMFDLAGGVSEPSYTITPTTNVKGLVTASKIRILDTDKWITNVNYYDNKAKLIYVYSYNDYLVTIDKVKYKFYFVGKIKETTKIQTRAGITNTIVDTYTYDNADRLLNQKQKINAQTEEIIVSNTYNEIGKLITKEVGGKITQNRLQTVDYKYNIRGWLKSINDPNAIGNDLFSFQINYNDPTATGTALYNGNISQTFWKTKNTDSSLKNYNYSYDALNRLTLATDNLNRYNENITYDKNGNITSLQRNGNTDANATFFGQMDNLTYSYSGNKLLKIEDIASNEGFKNGSNTTVEYTYDANGNMKTDANKGITNITYNYLNLPVQVTLAGSTINYVYDATGAKQRKIAGTTNTDYANGFQYENNVLRFYATSEGYVSYNLGTFTYIYQYKDHLGNVRLSYADNNNDGAVTSAEIVEESNYYPFGLKQKVAGEVIFNSSYKYKYNGKELQDELGLNMYDYGARLYDPARAGWSNVDPLTEKYPNESPYVYCANNPIIYIDPDGKEKIVVVGDQEGSPNSDRKNRDNNTGYKYKENSRHFLQAGLDSARKYKESAGDEMVTMIIYKGQYTNDELKLYQEAGAKSGINVKVISDDADIIDYVNKKSEFAFSSSARDNDLITDFTYVGHGWTKSMLVGGGSIIISDGITPSDLNTKAFDENANIFLNSCGSGHGSLFSGMKEKTKGTVTGFNSTVIWGEGGLGTYRGNTQEYYFPWQNRESTARKELPANEVVKTEKGTRK